MDNLDSISKMFPNISDIEFMKELTNLLEKHKIGERVGVSEYIIAGHLYSCIASLKIVFDSLEVEKGTRG